MGIYTIKIEKEYDHDLGIRTYYKYVGNYRVEVSPEQYNAIRHECDKLEHLRGSITVTNTHNYSNCIFYNKDE